MKNDVATDKICVRLCDEDGNYKSSYFTTNLDKTLAMYKYASENDIWIDFRIDDDKVVGCTVEDVRVNFGGGENLLSIDLYCSICEY